MFIEDDDIDERQNAVQSVLTAAMGKAARSLEKVIDSEVAFSEPGVNWVRMNNLTDSLDKLHFPESSVVMRQSFRGHLRGEMLILLEQGAKHYRLGSVMGYEGDMNNHNIQELTLELANILSGACINAISDELNIHLNFNNIYLLSNGCSVVDIFLGKNVKWNDALFMDVSYTVSSINMKTHLIMCMIEEDSQELYTIIDKQLNQ